jgi:hypothetical protein
MLKGSMIASALPVPQPWTESKCCFTSPIYTSGAILQCAMIKDKRCERSGLIYSGLATRDHDAESVVKRLRQLATDNEGLGGKPHG